MQRYLVKTTVIIHLVFDRGTVVRRVITACLINDRGTVVKINHSMLNNSKRNCSQVVITACLIYEGGIAVKV